MQTEVTCHPVCLMKMLLNCSFSPLTAPWTGSYLRVWRRFVTLLLAQHTNYPPWIWFHPVSHWETKDFTQPRPGSLLIYRVSVSWYLHLYAWLSGPVATKQLKNKERPTLEGQVWDCGSDLRCLCASGYHTLSQKQLPCLTDNKRAAVIICGSRDAT